MKRYTEKCLRELVRVANEAINLDEHEFAIDAAYGGYKVCLRRIKGGAEKDLYYKRGNSRYAACEFMNWLFNSSCPREKVYDIWEFAYDQGIRF